MKKGEALGAVGLSPPPPLPFVSSQSLSSVLAVTSPTPSSVPSFVSTCRMFAPWDLLRGRDVFKDSVELEQELDDSALAHWAPNCATFSRAREIPIKNVTNPPRPLRSTEHPAGVPAELLLLSKKSLKRLRDDTRMADMAAENCLKRHRRNQKFTLEHPGRSIALFLPSWKKLREEEGVMEIFYHTCCFEGSRRKKFQVLITNEESFVEFMGKTCQGTKFCTRTGERHLKWRPTVDAGRVTQFQTGDEREYPRGFCAAYSEAAAKVLGDSGMFCEVFSGPNAPLSQEVGKRLKSVVPGRRLKSKDDKGVKRELQHLAELVFDTNLQQMNEPHHHTEVSRSREITVQSGKQLGYGKRVQLIPDGRNDPLLHLKSALALRHPFESETSLKADHRVALDCMDVITEEAIKHRLGVLAEWKEAAESAEVLRVQSQHEQLASKSAVKLGRKPRTALMEYLNKRYDIEDKAVPYLCLKGIPIVGKALESPFFDEYVVPASITIKELLASAPTRRTSMIKRIKTMATAGSSDLSSAIWSKTLKEVEQGTMSGPYNLEEIEEKHGRFYNVVPSFGLEQGVSDSGTKKFRRIDDHSACHNNLAAERRQKIEMAGVDYLMVLISALSQKNFLDLLIATEDMKQAYRQVPLPDSQLSLSITGVYCPADDKVKFFELYGQPFGAAHAVPNFYRVAEWLNRALVRGFRVLLDQFFDDFFVVLRRREAEETMFVIKEAVALLGFVFDEEKSQLPANVAMVLGVAFNTASLKSQKTLLVEPKPTRVTNLCLMIDNVISKGCLTPTQAASVTGKFGFLCSTLFGKVGRCCTGALRARQYGPPDDTELNPSLITSLKLMKVFITSSPYRQLTVQHTDPPVILYTDASDVPERLDQRWVLGAVMIDPLRQEDVQYTSWTVPQDVISTWLPKQSYMGQLEILACPLALNTWAESLSGRRVLLFVDNDAAAACLVRGYSPKTDSSALVGSFWLLASRTRAEIYIDRVESKSNIADGPSRLDFSLLESLHATFVSPNVNSLFLSDLSWFVDS